MLKPVPEGVEIGLLEPIEVGCGIGVIPEHRGAEVVLDSAPVVMADDDKEEAARPKPPPDPRKQLLLILKWQVDHGIERNHRVEGGRITIPSRHIRFYEGATADELSRSLYLDVREVEPNYVEPRIYQEFGSRYPRSATEVKDSSWGLQLTC